MECVNIRFNIFWKSGNETFQMMNRLPKSINFKFVNQNIIQPALNEIFTKHKTVYLSPPPTTMDTMFAQSLFSQDVSYWNISSVTDMRGMFLSSSVVSTP